MLKIAIIVGSTRPNRKSASVARWVHEIAAKRRDAEYQVVDLRHYRLPLLDEPQPPSMGNYEHEHTRRWSETIEGFDGFVFVTPEYNHGTSASLKNAIDFLYAEWNDKAAGFVSYGSALGARAVASLRSTMAEIQIADVRAHVMLSTRTDWQKGAFRPDPFHVDKVNTLLDQVVAWAGALRSLRERNAMAKAA